MKKVCIKATVCMMLCASLLHAKKNFETIDSASAYAKRYPELVPIDNQDYLNPDYSSFYESFVSTKWDRALQAVGLKHKPEWQPDSFLELLKRLTENRKKDGLHGSFLQRQEVAQDDHFLVWSNLQGAFHSLVIALEYLKEKNIIDNNFKLIAPKYYIIFNGNVIDRSPYSLETLTIVLRLLEVNPTRVFYVRGDHETEGLWEDFDFRSETEKKIAMNQGLFPPYKNDIVPHTDEINAFFDTLPKILYLAGKTADRADGIRISFCDRSDFELTNEEMQYILNANTTSVIPVPIVIPKEQENNKPGSIYAMLEGSDDIIPDYTSDGLRMLPPDRGTTAWSVLSAPTATYQKLYNFYTDSYVDIVIKNPMKKTSITQYYQDVRKRDGFIVGRIYNMFSGQAEEQFTTLAQHTMINVGTTVDLQGATSTLGKQTKAGISLAINKQNQQGIIANHLITLSVFNDGGIITKIRPTIEILMKEHKANIILSPNEALVRKEYLDLVEKKEILVAFPFNAEAMLYHSAYSNIIHYGPSYIEEGEISTRYILQTIGPRKVAIFYESGNIGEDALIGARTVFKERGYTSFIEMPFKSNVLDFKDQIAQIQRENPDVLALFCSVAVAQEFIHQIGIQNLVERIIYGTSSLGVESFRHYYKERNLQFITTNLVPNPVKSDLLIAQDFRKEAAANNVPLSPQAFQAYISGSIFVEGLRLIKGPITNESIIKSFESMKNYAFKGLTLNFDAEWREMSNYMWLDDGVNDEWKRFEATHHKPGELEAIRKDIVGKIEGAEKKQTQQTHWW